MKINSLNISNFQALTDVNLDFKTPVTLIAAANEQGKTSISDAIAMAFGGASNRVALKKDYDQLVRDGAKKGRIALDWSSGKSTVLLPAGSLAIDGDKAPAAIQYVLSAARFPGLSGDERRKFLFALLDAKASADDLSKRLLARGHSQERITAASIAVGAEFAHKSAKAKTSEARASWKTTTGEAYGEVKAETWTLPEVEFDAGVLEVARQLLADLQAERTEIDQRVGAYRQSITTRQAQARHLETLREKAGHHSSIKVRLDTNEANLITAAVDLENSRAAALLCNVREAPSEVRILADILTETFTLADKTKLASTLSGEILDWDAHLVARMAAALQAYREAYGANAKPSTDTVELAGRVEAREQAYLLMKRSVENARRDLAEAELAAKELAAASVETATDIADPSAELVAIIAKTNEQSRIVLDLEEKQRMALRRDAKINAAADYHAEAKAWNLLADDLAPDGIPSEMLTEALKPFNSRLATTARRTGFSVVRIDTDMQITLDGRLYSLCSESARWLADAAIAEAIGHLSDLRMMIIDRFDVLDVGRRSAFLQWIDQLADEGELDFALILATLKALPEAFTENWTTRWLEGGTLYSQMQEAA